MKALKKKVLFFTISVFILSSCSLHKRHYMQGYHIEWKNSKHKIQQSEIATATTPSKEKPNEEVEATARINFSPSPANKGHATINNAIVLIPSQKADPAKGAKSLFDSQNEQDIKSYTSNDIKPEEDKKKSGPSPIPGILMMLLGLLLLGLGYIFYTNLGVFIGTFFFLVFGIGGAIFFIIGIVMLFVR